MFLMGLTQIVFYLLVLLLLIKPLGLYIAKVFQGQACGLDRILGFLERFIYRLLKIDLAQEMTWRSYGLNLLMFNAFGLLFLYALQRCQAYLPFNPQAFAGISPALAWNVAASFVTNTNWQAYIPEAMMSYSTQMLGLTVQNFLSAATGLCVLVVLIRGLARSGCQTVGNFWVDLTRGVLYLLLPIALLFAVVLVSQGVIQNLKPYQVVHPLQSVQQATTPPVQVLPMGPTASQVAIKQIGTNGGGFFNANSAHPFENPTPLTNFLEMLALLLIPASLCYTFGIMVKDQRQGYALLIAMTVVFFTVALLAMYAEGRGHPQLNQLKGLSDFISLEGKETRFGVNTSALYAVATTASANGSVNAMLDSFTPLGILGPLVMMQLGEIIFGGIGTGLTSLIMILIITVFVSGLMVGRTPEYLGKKIEPFEMKMASLVVLIMPCIVLLGTAIAVSLPSSSSVLSSGIQGFSEALYAFTSMGNNNGSALAGFNAAEPLYVWLGGIVMLVGRFWIIIAILAIAGKMAAKKNVPISAGTLATHTPLFIVLLLGVAFLIGALSFFPALSLGPVIDHLQYWNSHG